MDGHRTHWKTPQTALAALCLLCAAAPGGDTPPPMTAGNRILAAHRGVVTETIPENSLASLEETIRRGYTHIEVDLRCTRDGRAVCLHDDRLRRAAGSPRAAGELTLDELRALAPVEKVPDFETFCARSAGRIALMPDIKECPEGLEAAFAADIERCLAAHGLLDTALFIGRGAVPERFKKAGGSLRAVSPEAAAGTPPAGRFVFGHAKDFDGPSVRAFQALGLKVVVSINTFHYLGAGDWRGAGGADVKRMLECGVDGLQIDSVYEPAFREHAGGAAGTM
ncbi:MAG: hypothetical protein GXY15_04705 [Candidatus Hydrogenedentes bacterium]|nr:hypothetical protein [Candidatus Hydrogenedentota bacterium]